MYDFFAFLDRMKYIRRWSLMRSARDENIMEHSQQVAMFAHALAVIDTELCGGKPDVMKTVLWALYHESAEVMTGDLPTPIKYFNSKIRGVKLFRVLFYLPSITSTVAASIVWLWLMNPAYGLLNNILTSIGLPAATWLTHSSTALVSVTIITVWQGVGGNMIIFVAALQNVPVQLYEAAKLDGAGPLTIFFRITLPMLAPTMYFILTMTLIGAFQLYDQVYVLTEGGPANSTLTPVYLIWQNSFGNNAGAQAGYAAAQSFILFIIIMLVTVIVRRFDRDSTKEAR